MKIENPIHKVKTSLKLWLFLLLVIFPIIIELLVYDVDIRNSYELSKTSGQSLIIAAIGYCCAQQCVKWAIKTKKSVNWAYFFGFTFNLIGLLGYWFYYELFANRYR